MVLRGGRYDWRVGCSEGLAPHNSQAHPERQTIGLLMHRGARRRRKKMTTFKSKSFICDRRSIAMSSACQESDMASCPTLPLSSSAAAKERPSLGRQLPGTIFVHDDSWQWGSRVTPRRCRSGLVRGLWRLIGSKCLLRLWRTALHLWSTKPPCAT
jgi:hypothetical protein